MRRVTQLFLVFLFLAGCPLAHDDPTPQACRSDDDCFTAEGEYCDRPSAEDGVCRLRRDSAVRPDRKLTPDTAPAADLGADLDAGPGADLDAVVMESGPLDATPDTPGGE
jgi:hypothetical protein